MVIVTINQWDLEESFAPFENRVLGTLPEKFRRITNTTSLVPVWARRSGNDPYFGLALEVNSEGRVRLMNVGNSPTAVLVALAGETTYLQKEERFNMIDGVTLEDFDEHVEDASIHHKTTSKDITYTVDITDLQATIDSLPKMINHNITINVNPGTINSVIDVKNFTGTGRLYIFGATIRATTHNIQRIIAQYNLLPGITFRGFNLTATSGNGVFVTRNSGIVDILHMNINAGSSSTSNFYGISVRDNPGICFLTASDISNKNVAIFAHLAYIDIHTGMTGSDNKVGTQCEASIIRNRATWTLTGETGRIITTSGIVFLPSHISYVTGSIYPS